MKIRNQYVKGKCFNNVESTLSPVSEAIPDQSLSIKDLFTRYTESTLEQLLIREIRQTQQISDGANPSFGDYTPLNLTYNEMYNKSIDLSIKYRDPSLRLPKPDDNNAVLEPGKETVEATTE